MGKTGQGTMKYPQGHTDIEASYPYDGMDFFDSEDSYEYSLKADFEKAGFTIKDEDNDFTELDDALAADYPELFIDKQDDDSGVEQDLEKQDENETPIPNEEDEEVYEIEDGSIIIKNKNTKSYINGLKEPPTDDEQLRMAHAIHRAKISEKIFMRNGEVKQKLVYHPEMFEDKIRREAEIARQEMIERNLRLAAWVALKRQFRSSNLNLWDRISLGNEGLMRAVEKYDPTIINLESGNSIKFSTYAVWWIREAIKRGIQKESHTIRSPIHAQWDQYHVKRVIDQLKANDPSVRIDIDIISDALKRTQNDLTKTRISTAMSLPRALNVWHGSANDQDNSLGLENLIAGDSNTESEAGNEERIERLERAFDRMSEEDQMLMRLYCDEGMNYTEIAKVMQYSIEWIRKKHIKICDNLRRELASPIISCRDTEELMVRPEIIRRSGFISHLEALNDDIDNTKTSKIEWPHKQKGTEDDGNLPLIKWYIRHIAEAIENDDNSSLLKKIFGINTPKQPMTIIALNEGKSVGNLKHLVSTFLNENRATFGDTLCEVLEKYSVDLKNIGKRLNAYQTEQPIDSFVPLTKGSVDSIENSKKVPDINGAFGQETRSETSELYLIKKHIQQVSEIIENDDNSSLLKKMFGINTPKQPIIMIALNEGRSVDSLKNVVPTFIENYKSTFGEVLCLALEQYYKDPQNDRRRINVDTSAQKSGSHQSQKEKFMPVVK